MAAPSGTVTFLFTDVEGSTALWREVPAAMEHALELHDSLLRSVIDRFDGYVFTTAGDSFAVAFERADAAVRCAIEIQRQLRDAPWPAGAELRIRMGLHSGEAHERDGDYFGPAVNLSARVMGLAAGGQILVSTATRAVVADSLRDDLTLLDLGSHELKGIGGPQRLFQVEAEGLEDGFPSLSVGVTAGNLAVDDEVLVGRDRDLEMVRRLLGNSRLLTIVGVGGIGKTRLALSVAGALSGQWSDGTWLVELAPLGDGASLPQAVADAVGCRQHVGRTLTESVVEFFRRREALLVLDNCEHVLDAAVDLVDAVLAGAPGAQVLATSREALGSRPEQTYPLPSLAAGAPNAASELLFVRRAGEVAPHQSWDEHQVEAIGRICGRLDGIPLAIELAASRCRSMTPVDIARRLDDAFLNLRGGRRSVERHRTLKAAIDWSHDALDDDERAVFAWLSVFAGGWDLGAAEAVVEGAGVDPADVFDLLDSLVSRSLVVAGTGAAGVTRFRMLEPVRQYAEDQLSQRGQSVDARNAHSAWAVSWVADWTRQLPIADTRWRDALTQNIPNLRSAVEWSCQHHRADELVAILEDLVPAVQFLQLFEVSRWAEMALKVPAVLQHPRVAVAYSVALAGAFWGGATQRAGALAIENRRASEVGPKVFYSEIIMATEIHFGGDPIAALERLRDANPRTDNELAIRQYLTTAFRQQHGLDSESSLRALEELADRTGSDLPLAIHRNQLAQQLLIDGPPESVPTVAWQGFEASNRIGATFLVIQAAARLARAADAVGVIVPRTAAAAAAVLADMRDSGQILDQWLIIHPFAYPLWRLGHKELASQIRRGFMATRFGGVEIAMARVASAEREQFERASLAAVADVPQHELVDAVLGILAEVAGPQTLVGPGS